jgi:CRP-like cAMP-binding protein
MTSNGMKNNDGHKNRIIEGLPVKESRIILPHLHPIWLRKGHVLTESGGLTEHVIFPDEALVSYISQAVDGESLEVGVVGHEGVIGLGALLTERAIFCAVVQVPGRAYMISSDVLRKEFGRCDVVHHILLRYTGALLIQLAQTAICNNFHSIEQRFCRWLLMANDRIRSNKIPMTQDAMSRILGSRRASISSVAGALQKKGILQYNRGIISILNREALEAECCECYQTILTAFQNSVMPTLRL